MSYFLKQRQKLGLRGRVRAQKLGLKVVFMMYNTELWGNGSRTTVTAENRHFTMIFFAIFYHLRPNNFFFIQIFLLFALDTWVIVCLNYYKWQKQIRKIFWKKEMAGGFQWLRFLNFSLNIRKMQLTCQISEL